MSAADDLLPEGALETARLTVIAFIREDGTSGYGVAAKGDMPMTTYLGLTIVAQDEIKGWNSGGSQ